MSKSEDYLDQLLKGLSPEDENPEESMAEENIFGDDDLLDDDFLKEFQMEMSKLEDEDTEETGTGEEDILSLFDDLDSILSGAKEQMEAVLEPAMEEEMEPVMEEESMVEEEPAIEDEPVIEDEPAFVDEPAISNENDAALEALLGMGMETTSEETAATEEPAAEEGFSFANLFADDSADTADTAPQEDADVLKILEGLEGIDLGLDEEEAGTGSDTKSDDNAIESFAFEEDTETESDSAPQEEKTAKKAKKSGEKTGFMNKLGLILFGEDDEDEEEEQAKKKKSAATPSQTEGDVSIGVASDDDLALFGDYSGTPAASTEEEKKPEKGKKEKKKREKKEKVKKEKKPRPKKEKKPKKPKEPDNTPPLPKKPVFLIFLMVGSLLALIVMGADLLGYANQMSNAKNQYAKKNYSEAFAEISGMEIKKEDEVLYNKYHVMAMVSVELEAYESLMGQEYYEMALDCLVRTVGRAEKYRADAETYGCIQELNELELKAEEILSETFGVSKEEALEFYTYRSKQEYSTAIANVIKELGLER